MSDIDPLDVALKDAFLKGKGYVSVLTLAEASRDWLCGDGRNEERHTRYRRFRFILDRLAERQQNDEVVSSDEALLTMSHETVAQVIFVLRDRYRQELGLIRDSPGMQESILRALEDAAVARGGVPEFTRLDPWLTDKVLDDMLGIKEVASLPLPTQDLTEAGKKETTFGAESEDSDPPTPQAETPTTPKKFPLANPFSELASQATSQNSNFETLIDDHDPEPENDEVPKNDSRNEEVQTEKKENLENEKRVEENGKIVKKLENVLPDKEILSESASTSKLETLIDDVQNLSSPVTPKDAMKHHLSASDLSSPGSGVSVKARAALLSSNEGKVPMPSSPLSAPKEGKSNKSSTQDLEHVGGLSPAELKFLVASVSADYQAIARLLNDNPQFAPLANPANGYTALHWAARRGSAEVVKLLAGRYKVNVNRRSHSGHTPLHSAAMFDRHDVMHLLTAVYGANPNMRDNSGRLPSSYTGNQLHTMAVPPLLQPLGYRGPVLPPSCLALAKSNGSSSSCRFEAQTSGYGGAEPVATQDGQALDSLRKRFMPSRSSTKSGNMTA